MRGIFLPLAVLAVLTCALPCWGSPTLALSEVAIDDGTGSVLADVQNLTGPLETQAVFDLGDGYGGGAYANIKTDQMMVKLDLSNANSTYSGYAKSILSDTFRVNGPGSTAQLDVSLRLQGTLSVQAAPGASGDLYFTADIYGSGASPDVYASATVAMDMDAGNASSGLTVGTSGMIEGVDYTAQDIPGGKLLTVDMTLRGIAAVDTHHKIELNWRINLSGDALGIASIPIEVKGDFWTPIQADVIIPKGHTVTRNVPEPTTLALLLGGAALLRRRR